MNEFNRGGDLVLRDDRARRRVLEYIEAAAERCGWPRYTCPLIGQVIDVTIAELPQVIASTNAVIGWMVPAFGHGLNELAGWLNAPFADRDPAAIGEEMLRRAYVGMRVLGLIPNALSAQGFVNLLFIYDVLGDAIAGALDREIIQRFPGSVLPPVMMIAAQLRQLQLMGAGPSGRYDHPIYGRVTIDEVVNAEMGRYGIV